MSRRVAVAQANEIQPGQHKVVMAERWEIGIFNIRGEYYALRNYCPHQGAPLCRGAVHGTTLPSQVHQFIYGRAGEIVLCPWHGWEFDIRTGRSLVDPDKVRTRSYPVIVENGTIFVEL